MRFYIPRNENTTVAVTETFRYSDIEDYENFIVSEDAKRMLRIMNFADEVDESMEDEITFVYESDDYRKDYDIKRCDIKIIETGL